MRVVGPTEAAKFFGNSIDGWLRYQLRLYTLPLPSPWPLLTRLPLPARSIKLYKIAPDLGRLLLNAPRHLAPVSCRTPPPLLSSLPLLLHPRAHVVHAVHGKSGVVVARVESAAQIGCGLRGLLADPTGLTSHF